MVCSLIVHLHLNRSPCSLILSYPKQPINEVYCCNEELAFIEKVHVNPLELLFEAEAALALSEKQAEYSGDTRSDSSDDTTPDTEFVDDPIELMKKLKKKRGGA